MIEPFGLGGWGWGVLRLHDVSVDPATALLGKPGSGLAIFHQHFAGFRPLVTATALGAAASVHGLVAGALAARRDVGILPRVRDNALITLGRTRAEITADLLAALTASRLAAAGHPDASLLARLGKATGVHTAIQAVADLAPLIGATGVPARPSRRQGPRRPDRAALRRWNPRQPVPLRRHRPARPRRYRDTGARHGGRFLRATPTTGAAAGHGCGACARHGGSSYEEAVFQIMLSTGHAGHGLANLSLPGEDDARSRGTAARRPITVRPYC
ncbi:acyl-CoA dehydrogenase family protein [Krasilnikovia sp. M28-CT-15]|uniref:acyl-CoA dehydrogenase family protein n=1 Tax=Krasilnikovia sp. M28-CT-15 TaxID=3373540 RepID=UPI0038768C7D